MIPRQAWALNLIREQAMPEHIIRHCLLVRKVAVRIGELIHHRCPLDMELIDRAALLHDICKMESINTGGDHAMMGQELLEGLGYPRVGRVIGQHVRLQSEARLDEAMVVNYADKRVMHDNVVSLEERLADIIKRYAVNEAALQKIMELNGKFRQIEQRLCSGTGFDPASVSGLRLVAGDDPFDGGHGVGREYGPAELYDQNVDPVGVDEDQPALIHERNFLR